MDVLTAISNRRSIRKFTNQPVEDEKLNKILEAARLAPSAANKQVWRFIVVKNPALREKMVEAAAGQAFLGQAPVILVACATDATGVMMCGQPRYTIDLSIATAYMILEAHELGLGTCWLGRFDEQKVKDALGIPAEARVVAISPLGYPDESPAPRPRKALEEIVSYDKF